jgi:DNA repair protein RadC
MAMSQLSFTFSFFDSSRTSPLMVCDERGRYAVASDDQILEAAQRVIGQKVQRGVELTDPKIVREYLRGKLAERDHETFAVLLLNSQCRLIDYVEMFQGTIDRAAVYPREVLKLALQRGAASMIVSHNHPSGTPEPSMADLDITKQLKSALALIDVRLIDHVIVAGATTLSFSQRGLL